ncbi:NADPH:quinone oxidoreductase family protein [Actinoplanes sp. CA-054009]
MTVEGSAWRLGEFGDPAETVRLERLAYGPPPTGQVLVRVRAAGAGHPDAMMAAGRYPLLGTPPFGLGEEVAGEVVAAPGGSRFAVGERVMGITMFLAGWGGFAEYAYVREQSAIPVPAHFTDEQAAGFPIGFRTAYAALVERAALQAGETVVVLGAAGSTGGATVRLAKALGATAIAVAGSDEKVRFAAADHGVNHRTENLPERIRALTGGRGADIVVDVVGGETAARATSAMARGGRFAVVGFASGTPVALDATAMLLGNWSAVGVLSSGYTVAEDAVAWGRLGELAGQGLLDTPVGRIWSYGDVPAMIAGQSAAAPGKHVVRVP